MKNRKCIYCRHKDDCDLWIKPEGECTIAYVDPKWHKDDYSRLTKKNKGIADMKYEKSKAQRTKRNGG